MQEINPALIYLGAIGVLVNILLNGGTLWKLMDFSKDYGALKERVETHAGEIERLRNKVEGSSHV